jgi:hypothetical protein
VEPGGADQLAARGHKVTRVGEYAAGAIGMADVQIAGTDPGDGERLAASDPRAEGSAAAQSTSQRPRGRQQRGRAPRGVSGTRGRTPRASARTRP